MLLANDKGCIGRKNGISHRVQRYSFPVLQNMRNIMAHTVNKFKKSLYSDNQDIVVMLAIGLQDQAHS